MRSKYSMMRIVHFCPPRSTERKIRTKSGILALKRVTRLSKISPPPLKKITKWTKNPFQFCIQHCHPKIPPNHPNMNPPTIQWKKLTLLVPHYHPSKQKGLLSNIPEWIISPLSLFLKQTMNLIVSLLHCPSHGRGQFLSPPISHKNKKPKYMFDGTVIQRDELVYMDCFYENDMSQSDLWGESWMLGGESML